MASDTDKPKRTRSRTACTWCHNRKVRCDTAIIGTTCTNCKLDGVFCTPYKPIKCQEKRLPSKEPSRQGFALPNYIKAPPVHLTNDDIQYIKVKGALRLPSPRTCEKLWKAYFLLVHPIVPILDREQVLRSLHLNDGGPKISLLLFYSIMLTAQLFLDAQESSNTVSASARSMFEKARMLHDLRWETDELTILQASLLMTYYPQSDRESRNRSYWLSSAISLAYKVNLHRDPTALAISARQRSLRKQMWWCLLIRERMISLDSETPWIIDEQDHDVPMLTMDDIALAPLLPSPDTSKLVSNIDYATQQRQLGAIFVEKAKLAVILSRLAPIYIISWDWDKEDFDDHWPRPALRSPDTWELDQIDKDLDFWRANIPIELLCIQTSMIPSGVANKRNQLAYLHYGTLIHFYRIVSHHSASLRWLQSTLSSHPPSEYVRTKLMEATISIVHFIEDLATYQSITFVQLTGVSLARPLLLWKILNNLGANCSPFLESNYMNSFVEKLDKYDSWVARAMSYIALSPGALPSPLSDTEFGSSPHTPNDFDAAFDSLCMDKDKLGYNSVFPYYAACSADDDCPSYVSF